MQSCSVIDKVQTQAQLQTNPHNHHKRIGLYGGTFNPIHNAHLFFADQVGHALSLDRVDFLPDAKPPHVDHKSSIDPQLRLQMLQLAIADNPFLGIEQAELARGGVSYTYDTIKELLDKHPDTEYYFIIGGDMVDYLEKWYRIADLIRLPRFHFVGIHRQGAKNETKYPVIWVDVPTVDFSSTNIRQRIKNDQSIKYMVPDAVREFIEEHQLYRE
ncbi:nicotinate-nucleotide adenylyltransferase [Lactobacillus sp. 0.1XD8-4]|uniref:Probable nicotinate-nucleotide adenylyltransferase n=1 Tax=Limosilactobacillus walteri TaxID=2268022 RepID=A0ABR8P8V2_9LACO|nr:nicotinate-nucleotide adenylyltransferase [uncultured Limosilactobacillus sp.]MBD5807190.1 nicotinate-nucleotide adenylyltransferase [Limosilactobacillus walteri]MRN07273.1 nicotinate-nucleotide adenylyltransferase [Lactobacillus sp. 0.1XD8-4]